jgi:hypothetical protein
MTRIVSDEEIRALKKAGKSVGRVGGGALMPRATAPVKKDPQIALLEQIATTIGKAMEGTRINADAIKTLASTMVKILSNPQVTEKHKKLETPVRIAPKSWEMDVVRGTDGFIDKVKIRETSTR